MRAVQILPAVVIVVVLLWEVWVVCYDVTSVPGDDDWRPSLGATHTNCIFCPYDRVCAADRGEQWLRLREAGELAPYVELAEGEWGDDDGDDQDGEP